MHARFPFPALIPLALLLTPQFAAAQTPAPAFLFDATKAEMAGNADWVIDADKHNLDVTQGNGSGKVVTGTADSNPQQTPTPAASGITASTPETYWTGALSSFGVGLVKAGDSVQSLPFNARITYGDSTNAQDLSHYSVYVVDEPNILFSASEKTAILKFVQNGGGLLMVADHTGSDRNNDGKDSLQVWNDLMTNNAVQKNPFGITFQSNQVSPASESPDAASTNPITHGTAGTVTGFNYSDGCLLTIDPAQNSTVKGAVWSTSSHTNTNLMVAYASFGKGKVVAIGDSSPLDDGTGDSNDSLFNGWTSASDSTLVLNASQWLAQTPAAAPEPSGWVLLCVGMGLLGVRVFSKRRPRQLLSSRNDAVI